MEQLGVADLAQGLAEARQLWQDWVEQDPRLAPPPAVDVLQDWLMLVGIDAADEVLHALIKIGSPCGKDCRPAAWVVAWALLPGAIAVARRAPAGPETDALVASQLWLEIRQFPWWRHRKVAGNVLANVRSVLAREGVLKPVRALQNPRHVIETQDRPRIQLSFALCPTCRQADELAERMSGAPATRSPWARQLLGGALDALSFLNPKSISTGEVEGFDDLSMRALVRHLGQLGTQARWMNRPGANHEFCNRYGFAHLMPGARHELRTAYASWLKERAARHASAVKISPPPVLDNRSGSAQLVLIESGCLVCGVGHQTVPAAVVAQQGRFPVARDVWKPLRTQATQLGAQSSLEVSGYLCRICASALEQSQSVGLGPTALERALVAHLCPEGIPKLASGNLLAISGLRAWGALAARSQVPPNAQPWAHLGDLAEIRKQLKTRLNV